MTEYQLLNNKEESIWLKDVSYSKALIEYSNDMNNIYENIERYNPNKKRKVLAFLMIWLLTCLVMET